MLPSQVRSASLLLTAGAMILGIGPQTPAAESDSPDTRIRVARLVKDLGSPSYRLREAADVELSRLGPESREELEKAARDDDPEIRLRARRLLKQIKISQLWKGTPIDLTVTDMSVADAVGEVVKQSGNDIAVGDQYGSFEEATITSDRGQSTFWPVVDEICRKSGNRVRLRYGTAQPGFVLVSGELGRYPVAYAGPIRAQITDARRVFVEEFDYKDQSSETTHTFQLNLLLTWENRFRIVAHQAQLALDKAVAKVPTRMVVLPGGETGWQMAENSVRQFSSSLRLEPPPRGVARLDQLTLLWDVIAVGDMTEFALPAKPTRAAHRQDGLAVVIQEMAQTSNTRWDLTVAVSRELIVPEPEEILYLENEFELQDAEGRPFGLHARRRLDISNGTARIKLTYITPTTESAPHQLVVRYPRIRDRRAIPITFHNVPLPVAHPE